MYQATAGQTWTLIADDADGHDVRLRPPGSARLRARLPGRQLRPRRRSEFPARTTRAPATRATPAIRCSTPASAPSATATAGTRSSATSGPTRCRRTSAKMKGRHDLRGGYLMNFFYLDHWQPETGNPRGPVRLQRPRSTAPATRGAQNAQLLQTSTRRSCSAYVGTPSKSVQNELMTAREWQHSLFVRDRWTPSQQADARPRHALRALPDHAPRRRTRRRSARPATSTCSSPAKPATTSNT